MSTTNATPVSCSPRSRSQLGALALLAVSGVASAEDQRWRWSVTPYAWATDVGLDARLDGRQVIDETIPVEDLIEDIDMTFQGRIEAQRGEHGFLLDVFYVSMSDKVNAFELPHGSGTGDLDWRMDMTIADIAATFDPRGDDCGFSYLYGARIIDQRTEADGTFTTTGGTTSQAYDSGDTLVDVLCGLRFATELAPHLELHTQLDASTGGTDYTWSAFPSLSYSFGGSGAALVVGFKHMEISFKESAGADTAMTLSGPVLGLQLSF